MNFIYPKKLDQFGLRMLMLIDTIHIFGINIISLVVQISQIQDQVKQVLQISISDYFYILLKRGFIRTLIIYGPVVLSCVQLPSNSCRQPGMAQALEELYTLLQKSLQDLFFVLTILFLINLQIHCRISILLHHVDQKSFLGLSLYSVMAETTKVLCPYISVLIHQSFERLCKFGHLSNITTKKHHLFACTNL